MALVRQSDEFDDRSSRDFVYSVWRLYVESWPPYARIAAKLYERVVEDFKKLKDKEKAPGRRVF